MRTRILPPTRTKLASKEETAVPVASINLEEVMVAVVVDPTTTTEVIPVKTLTVSSSKPVRKNAPTEVAEAVVVVTVVVVVITAVKEIRLAVASDQKRRELLNLRSRKQQWKSPPISSNSSEKRINI